MQTFLPLLQPSRRRAYLGLSWLKICVGPPRWRERRSIFTRLGWELVGWILVCCFLRMISYLRRKGKLIKCGEKLYKCSFSRSYLLYAHPKAMKPLLKELHEGICESHRGGKSLSHMAFTQGYLWPNMQKEAQEYVKKCDQCQTFAPNIHQPRGVLNLYLALGLFFNGAWIL